MLNSFFLEAVNNLVPMLVLPQMIMKTSKIVTMSLK